MKLKELIEKLKTYDHELLVVTRGMDETDFADIETVKVVTLKEIKTSIADYKKFDDESAMQALLVDHF